MTTPEEAEKEDREYYRSLTPDERVQVLLEIRNAWIAPADQRLERTYRIITVPPR